jgi:DNA-binding MarR family transcriptional regulator
MAGAAMTEALYEADPDNPAPDKTAIVLSCAAQPGHTRPRQLIEQTALSSSGVSQLLDRLENAGLVRRRTGEPPDRRAVTVELTQHGRQHLERQLARVAEHLTLLQQALDEPGCDHSADHRSLEETRQREPASARRTRPDRPTQ